MRNNPQIVGQKQLVLLQPGFAHYRSELFRELGARHDMICVYSKSTRTYPGNDQPQGLDFIFSDDVFSVSWVALFILLIRLNPKVVLVPHAGSIEALIARIYVSLFRKRLVLWTMEWREFSSGELGVRQTMRWAKFQLKRWQIRSCDALVAMGTRARDFAISLGKSEREIFTTINCSLEAVCSVGESATRSESDVGYTFLYLARILDWKGLDYLIQAFARLEGERDDVRLLIAGDGPFKRYCTELVQQLGVQRIEFLGSVAPSDSASVYRKADVFVLPSCFRNNQYEAWGLVVNEAMSMGLPVITTTAVGAAFDMIEEGRNGFVVEQGSDQALYDAIKKILTMDLPSMGRRSREIFREVNSASKVADVFSDAIRAVC